MIRTTLFALLAGTAMAGVTFAQDAAPQANAPAVTARDNPILRLDTDGDGQITLEEAQAAPANPMALADSDGDGTVTRDEVIAAATGRAAQRAADRAGAMFDRFDEDGDGQIAIDNLPEPRGNRGERIVRMFERADANGDGVLDAEEIADLPERPMKGHGKRGGHGHGRDRG